MRELFENMEVRLLDVLGSDLMVVNAARVSHGKRKNQLDNKDVELLRYLAENDHWTPFAHPHLQFRIKAPIFVARQLMRSTVGLVVNEVSRRYVDSAPTYYIAEARNRVKNVKQGSGDEIIDGADDVIKRITFEADKAYHELLARGVAPEIARTVLPVNMITEWIWTGSLAAFIRICKLRMDKNAQKESQFIAREIFKSLRRYFPKATAIYEEL